MIKKYTFSGWIATGAETINTAALQLALGSCLFSASSEVETVKFSDFEEVLTDLLSSLTTKLNNGPAAFIYKKKDGSVRKAFGTLFPPLINQLSSSTGASSESSDKPKKAQPEHLFTYFDLEALQFRAFDKEQLITIF